MSNEHKQAAQEQQPVTAPAIVTGFEAIGRGTDKNKLMEFLQVGAGTFGESFLSILNPHNAIERLASAMGISTEGLIKTPEEMQAESRQARQTAQGQMMMEKLGPEIIRQGGNLLNQSQ